MLTSGDAVASRNQTSTYSPSPTPFDCSNPDPECYEYVDIPLQRWGAGTCMHAKAISCFDERCDCARNSTTCRKECICFPECQRQFPPCDCGAQCTESCPCKVYKHTCTARCSCISPCCGFLLLPRLFVGISKVKGAGKGLFTMDMIQANQFLGNYEGPTVSADEITDRSREFAISQGSSPFLLVVVRTRC